VLKFMIPAMPHINRLEAIRLGGWKARSPES